MAEIAPAASDAEVLTRARTEGRLLPAMVLNPDDIALSGNVTDKFKPAKAAF